MIILRSLDTNNNQFDLINISKSVKCVKMTLVMDNGKQNLELGNIDESVQSTFLGKQCGRWDYIILVQNRESEQNFMTQKETIKASKAFEVSAFPFRIMS